MSKNIVLLAVFAAGANASAVTVAVRHTTLDVPYLWQATFFNPENGYLDDNYGSKNFDVDGDGVDDIGFISGGGGIQVLANFNLQILVKKIGGPGDIGGVAARFDAGSIIGADSVTSAYGYSAISPNSFYYDPPTREELGDYYDSYDEPLPFDVPTTGTLHPRDHDLWKGRSGYLGFRLMKDGCWHYGWVYVEKDPLLTDTGGYVTAYAYWNTPNTAIIAQIPEISINLMAMLGGTLFVFRHRR